MGADHHQLVGLVGARNLRDHVERVQIGIVERVLDVELERDGNLLVEDAHETVVVLDRENDLGHGRRIRGVAGAAALHEHRAAIASAGFERRGDAFAHEERRAALRKSLVGAWPASAPRTAATSRGRRDRLPGALGELGVRITPAFRIEVRGHRARRRRQHVLASELAAECLEIAIGVEDGDHRLGFHRSIRAGRPRLRIANQRRDRRRQEMADKPIVGPSPAERSPGLELRVREPPALHFLHRPLARGADVRRSREPGSIDIREVAA